MTDGMVRASVGDCPTCGLRRFVTKSDAKAMTRKLRGQGKQRAFKCGEYWHHGHLPADVISGKIARAQLEPRKRVVS